VIFGVHVAPSVLDIRRHQAREVMWFDRPTVTVGLRVAGGDTVRSDERRKAEVVVERSVFVYGDDDVLDGDVGRRR
jgi:hypothetical protein